MEEREAAIELREKIEEQESLLEFLLFVHQRKKGVADNLQHAVSFLCSDIEGATKQQVDSAELKNNRRDALSNKSQLMKNFKKLESEYFLMRCQSLRKPTVTDGRSSIYITKRGCFNNFDSKDQCGEHIIARKNSFIDDLCKYLSFSKLKVKADLKQGDLLQSSNLVCALSFDREEAFFATAGVVATARDLYHGRPVDLVD